MDAAISEVNINTNQQFGKQAAMNTSEKNILLVDSKELFINVAQSSIELLADHFKIIAAANVETAQDILGSTKIDLIITALRFPGTSGFQFIEEIRNTAQPVPYIVWTTNLDAESKKKLDLLGAQHVLHQKPQDLNDLEDTILKVLSEDQEALFKELDLVAQMKKIKLQGNSCTLTVQNNDQTGSLYIDRGILINALLNGTDGDKAALEIFSWDHPKIVNKIDGPPNIEPQISDYVLSEIFGEQKRPAQTQKTRLAPSNPLNDAIQTIKAQNIKKGSILLSNFLKNYPQNSMAWFWLSRCSQELDKIEEYLLEAQRLSPDNFAVAEDLEKLKQAREKTGEEKIRRCPFCWAPISIKSIECHFCRAKMFYSDKMTLPISGCNIGIMNDAINDFKSVAQRENNPNILYFLSLASIHLGNKSDALFLLRRASKVAPEVKFLSNQLHILEKLLMSTPSFTADKISKKKILVVEDSTTTRKFIVKTLNKSGFETIEAEDGLEALSKLNSESPNLILLDIILPKMDGYKVLSIIKESDKNFANTPVIMLTSKDGMLNKLKGKMAGSSAYLTKPFKPDELVKTIEKFI